MQRWDGRENERQLDALFQAYREATPDPESGAAFMPGIWNRIEARRRFANRLAKGFMTLAAALSLLLTAFLFNPRSQNALVDPATYLEVLDDDHGIERVAYAEVRPDLAADSTVQ
jgi:hypothetical protein